MSEIGAILLLVAATDYILAIKKVTAQLLTE